MAGDDDAVEPSPDEPLDEDADRRARRAARRADPEERLRRREQRLAEREKNIKQRESSMEGALKRMLDRQVDHRAEVAGRQMDSQLTVIKRGLRTMNTAIQSSSSTNSTARPTSSYSLRSPGQSRLPYLGPRTAESMLYGRTASVAAAALTRDHSMVMRETDRYLGNSGVAGRFTRLNESGAVCSNDVGDTYWERRQNKIDKAARRESRKSSPSKSGLLDNVHFQKDPRYA